MRRLLALTLALALPALPAGGLIASPPAHAVVGVALGLPGLALSSMIFLLPAPWIPLYFNMGTAKGERHAELTLGAALGLGLILLEEDSSAVSFAPLPIAKARALGRLTAEEAEAYLSNRDELNAVLETVSRELAKWARPSTAVASALWAEQGRQLDPLAFRAAQKLIAGVLREHAARKPNRSGAAR